MIDPQHRVLNSANYRKNLCAGWATGYCTALSCKGYRRRNLLGEQDNRDLLSGASFSFTQQVNYANKALDKLVSNNQVSSSCKTLISKPRIIYGVVEYFKLWDANASPQKVINSNYLGQNIPKGLEINFEAVTNDCVDFC
jgi:hypothetical protein